MLVPLPLEQVQFRFARPVCYQGFPEEWLPDELKEENPLNIRVIKPFGFVFLKIATYLCLWCDVPTIEKGRIKGILTSKGEAWVEVKDD